MFEKIIPVIVALIALQFLIRFINRKKKSQQASTREFDYKKSSRFLRDISAEYSKIVE